jgi:hypothetical protein
MRGARSLSRRQFFQGGAAAAILLAAPGADRACPGLARAAQEHRCLVDRGTRRLQTRHADRHRSQQEESRDPDGVRVARCAPQRFRETTSRQQHGSLRTSERAVLSLASRAPGRLRTDPPRNGSFTNRACRDPVLGLDAGAVREALPPCVRGQDIPPVALGAVSRRHVSHTAGPVERRGHQEIRPGDGLAALRG